ncbi:MAG TPA: hypothetical protein VFK70_18130 [Vicinamibacteria bacterium]|nr:hypothetical protein [Vicinamibacteria bacterium]
MVADAGNQRVMPMDDVSGAGWATFTYPLVISGFVGPNSVGATVHGACTPPPSIV